MGENNDQLSKYLHYHGSSLPSIQQTLSTISRNQSARSRQSIAQSPFVRQPSINTTTSLSFATNLPKKMKRKLKISKNGKLQIDTLLEDSEDGTAR